MLFSHLTAASFNVGEPLEAAVCTEAMMELH